jgi:hypothetical protein
MVAVKLSAYRGLPSKVAGAQVLSKSLPKASLKVILTQISSRSATTYQVAEDAHYTHPCLIELEVTLVPARPLQVARISLEVEGSDLEVLGPPLYAETIQLPTMLQTEETYFMRFSTTPVKGERQAKVKVFAAGKEWRSRSFTIYC